MKIKKKKRHYLHSKNHHSQMSFSGNFESVIIANQRFKFLCEMDTLEKYNEFSVSYK